VITTGRVISSAVVAASVLSGSMAAYLGLLTVVGAARPRTPRRKMGRPVSFAIMVPAHDEQASIGETLDAMRRIDHPRFSVHVVADNCADRTADIVRARGFTVHERQDLTEPGKGPALNWLFDRLDATDEARFDIAVVVDADTIVEPGFLTELERAFSENVMVVQGHYGVRHPEMSVAVGLRAAALAARHHLRPLGRVRLGGSCGLFGNGMAFRRSMLRRHRWSGHLVEDAELQIELLLAGHRVVYASDARVFAEMPTSLEHAGSQNKRWELRRLQLLRTYGASILRQSLRGPAGQRLAAADEMIDLLVPPLSVLAASHAGLAVLNGAGAALGSRRHRFLLGINVAAVCVLVAHVLVALRSVRAPAAVYRSLAHAPAYAFWKLRTWLEVLMRPRTVRWTRTRRNAEAAH
jgi:cellulose synthase/poly-beta-1,6-N-acetylglucosamine synthase-like glycosyltransferase